MRKSIALGWAVGIMTFTVGAWAGANWYETRILPPEATVETLRQFAREGCEPLQASGVLFFRCPRLHVP